MSASENETIRNGPTVTTIDKDLHTTRPTLSRAWIIAGEAASLAFEAAAREDPSAEMLAVIARNAYLHAAGTGPDGRRS